MSHTRTTLCNVNLKSVSSSSKVPKVDMPLPDRLYMEIENVRNMHTIARNNTYLFDSNQWIRFYNEVHRHHAARRKTMRMTVQMGTIYAFLNLRYFAKISPKKEGEDPSSSDDNDYVKTVHFTRKKVIQSVQSTVKFREDTINSSRVSISKLNTRFDIVEGDMLDCALYLKNHMHLNPAMMIMASKNNPGGGYERATVAQEEDLCRRSNLFMCLNDPMGYDSSRKWSYPMPDIGGIYVPNCIVIRHSCDQGYGFLNEPQEMAMIAIHAYAHPSLEYNLDTGEYELNGSTVMQMTRKIECLCAQALAKGHNSLVLSALGSGAYQNPPKSVARIFKRVLQTGKYANCFQRVVFAIIDDSNALRNTSERHSGKGKGKSKDKSTASNVRAYAKVFQIDPHTKLEDLQ